MVVKSRQHIEELRQQSDEISEEIAVLSHELSGSYIDDQSNADPAYMTLQKFSGWVI